MTIRETVQDPGCDFSFLRQQGIAHIQALAGNNWTDHNEHDPGITILEQLCYAITDLCYRIQYDIPDLLATADGEPYQELFSPAHILTGKPVTLTDIRKLVLDVREVRNAWIEPLSQPLFYRREQHDLVLNDPQAGTLAIRGLYKVWIDVSQESSHTGSAVVAMVSRILADNRALCEDVHEVQVIKSQPVKVVAVIEVGEIEDPELFLAGICHTIEDYISPAVRFYTLPEMLLKGYTLDDVMNGPALQHGYIDDRELPALERKRTLYASDLIRELHHVPGLQAIKSIQLVSGNQVKDWKMNIGPGLIATHDLNIDKDITLQRNGIAIRVNADKVKKHLSKKMKKSVLPAGLRDIVMRAHDERSIGRYHSIQHHFPMAYALGEGELPDTAGADRHRRRQQLKAYLTLFDHILANQFSQVAHLKDIFSYDNTGTYFSQVPQSVPSLSTVLIDPAAGGGIQAESSEVRDQRKNRLLNHLMARFAEDFTHFSLLLPSLKDDARPGIAHNACQCKADFLKHYPVISGGRGSGINCIAPEIPGGTEMRIIKKLGFNEKHDRFFLIEHLLLRPTAADVKQQPAFMHTLSGDDPFSLQVSCLLHDSFEAHLSLIGNIIREETPAHIRIYMLMASSAALEGFAALYRAWREEMAARTNSYKGRGLRNRIIDLLQVGTTYPISDLPVSVQKNIVPYEFTGKIFIEYSETGVQYELFRVSRSGEEQPTGIVVPGTGLETLELETGPLNEDSQYVIFATKTIRDTTLRVRMNNGVAFKIGIDNLLNVSIREKGSITCGTSATLIIQDSQEKVSYKLTDENDNDLSDKVVSDGGEVRIVTHALYEDTTVVLKASRSFDDENMEIVEIKRLPIQVKPDASLNAEAVTAIVAHGNAARIRISATQKSVSYQLLWCAFDETSIRYELPASDTSWDLKYTAGNAARELYAAAPGDPADFQSSGLYPGNGGDLVLEIPALTQDCIWLVKAVKIRNGEMQDALYLSKRSLALVEPRTDLQYDAPAVVKKGVSAPVTISNPQRGVMYQLVSPDQNTTYGNQVVFHKNKAIGIARTGVDFVVDACGEETVTLVAQEAGSSMQYRIQAVQIYTGVTAVTGVFSIAAEESPS